MTEPFVYGQSYWEIVVHAFRKNWAARIALWVSVFLMAVAILAPLVANDRPFYFKGTMPGEYRKAYSGLTRGAVMAISTAPARMKAEQDRFSNGTATLGMYKERLKYQETSDQYNLLYRLNERAQSRVETRGIWESNDVPFNDVVEEVRAEQRELPQELATLKRELQDSGLSEETRGKKATRLKEREDVLNGIARDLETLESTRQRIVRELPQVYGERVTKDLSGLRLKLQEMRLQLGEEKQGEAAAIEREFEAILTSDYLTSGRDRKAELRALVDRIKAGFDPDQATLVTRTWWPLLSSLNALDVFLIMLLLGLGIAVGPLTWWKLKKLAPIERRWKVTWWLGATPAILVAAIWLVGHSPRFESVSYKAGVKDGSVVMTSSLWPVIPWRFDELPPAAAEGETRDRPPTAPSAQHPFGTDFLGRDLLSRMIWGARISLSIGFVAVGISLVIGVTLGALAGFYRGRVDMALSRVIEIVICFPTFFLVMAVVAFLPPSIYYVMLVLGLFGWMSMARLLRGEFLRLVNLDYVQAARALGATNGRIMFRHLLPNALGPVLVATSFGIAGAMITESALSFLGFGVQEPETSWGQILNTGRTHLQKPWTFMIPGAAIFLAVTCYNLVGDAIRDAVDPRLKT